jgi:hypothetical protein
MTPTRTRRLSLPPFPGARLIAGALLPLALAACNGGSDDDEPAAQPAPVPETPAPPKPETPAKNQAYLKAKPGDVIKVRIEELNPTQAAIGYDQIYYKLGRWQGDFARPTWAGDTTNQIDYLNRTVGKKFDDYCEDTGAGKRAQPFASIAQAQAARLDKPETFSCLNAPGADATAMKTVVVGWDGNLYLTDGHHSFSALREIFDGGPKLPVWVKVDANYSDMADAKAFWQRLVDERKAWLRDGQNRPITVEQLPTRLGLANATEPGGMEEDRYRSLVYFARDIAYDNGRLPEFAEFLWGDWLRRQVSSGQLRSLDFYKMAKPAPLPEILAASTLDKDLQPKGSSDGYSAAVREAALKMAVLADSDVVLDDRTAAQLGRIRLVPNAGSGTPTKNARDALEELSRNDLKAPGSPPRNGGKLWYSVKYRTCGAPGPRTCWDW